MARAALQVETRLVSKLNEAIARQMIKRIFIFLHHKALYG